MNLTGDGAPADHDNTVYEKLLTLNFSMGGMMLLAYSVSALLLLQKVDILPG